MFFKISSEKQNKGTTNQEIIVYRSWSILVEKTYILTYINFK